MPSVPPKTPHPLVTLHDVSENSSAMQKAVDAFRGIAADKECAIELVYHTRKGAPGHNGDHGADDIRAVAKGQARFSKM